MCVKGGVGGGGGGGKGGGREHSISYKIACAPSEVSYQPLHLHSLISLCRALYG